MGKHNCVECLGRRIETFVYGPLVLHRQSVLKKVLTGVQPVPKIRQVIANVNVTL